MKNKSEIEDSVDFSIIRYAQVWEDADILLDALNIQGSDVCLSISSAGDNALAMLAKAPARVIALDLNPAQLFCLELRVAAYKTLEHGELLELMGSVPCDNPVQHYLKCRELLTGDARIFWDRQKAAMSKCGYGGIGGLGKFERYFRIFKDWVLPLVHSSATVKSLLTAKSYEERKIFFDDKWNTWRWRLLVRMFFSQTMMGKMGRDPAFFKYAKGSFSEHVARRIEHGIIELDPSQNPYLHWILQGRHGDVLPFALRAENFESIRNNLDKLEWHLLSTDNFAEHCKQNNIKISKYNLSNIFEYMSEEAYLSSLSTLIEMSEPHARLCYWNMMVPRSHPECFDNRLESQTELAKKLHARDRTFFYRDLIIEDVR